MLLEQFVCIVNTPQTSFTIPKPYKDINHNEPQHNNERMGDVIQTKYSKINKH